MLYVLLFNQKFLQEGKKDTKSKSKCFFVLFVLSRVLGIVIFVVNFFVSGCQSSDHNLNTKIVNKSLFIMIVLNK